ncbi:ABC transporter ATP-binding protein [Neobacillus mesonae]|nr:ABC transporter ATP-binding protein [Neobacillus mesonae]
MSKISLNQVYQSYKQGMVLKNISIEIPKGECAILTGHNGSGKSTLLRVLAGLIYPTKGEVISWSNTGRMDEVRRGYAIDRLPPLPFTAEEYLLAMGGIQGIQKKLIQSKMKEWMEALHLKPEKNQQILSFSKGMRQKVNLMQSFIGEPELLLLDEPLSGLDYESQQRVTEMLSHMKKSGTTIVCASHEGLLIQRVADSIIELDHGSITRVINKDKFVFTNVMFITAGNISESAVSLLANSVGVTQVELLNDDKRTSYQFKVEAENSDKLLKSILELGGTVVSVVQDQYRFQTSGGD